MKTHRLMLALAATLLSVSGCGSTPEQEFVSCGDDDRLETRFEHLELGQSLYENRCALCHEVGGGGAPIVGQDEFWQSRLKKGKVALYKNAKHGLGAMPAKGGFPLSDPQIEAVVDYMVFKAKHTGCPE